MKRILIAVLGFVALVGFSAEISAAPSSNNPVLLETLFNLDRSTKEDVIYFRNKDVLRGRVLNETITIATQYGMIKVPLRRCAGLSFEGARANTEAVVTVNFNRITGIITDRVIIFQIKSSGTKIPIRKEKIRFLLLQKTEAEADFVKQSPKADIFFMANGDLLSGESVERKLVIRTDYAKIPVSFSEMKGVKMQGGDDVTAVIVKTNGDTMWGTLDTAEITLDLEIGVHVQAIYKDKFASMFIDQARKRLPAQFGVQQPVAGESEGVGPFPGLPVGQKALNVDLGDGVKLKMILIPAGKFTMGSPLNEKDRNSNEGPQREITISKPFYFGVYEVTQEQYQAVMGKNPSSFKGAKNPVEQVSWEDAMEFCQKLSSKTGHTYRLPTEAQWEYACRGGTKTAYSWGASWRTGVCNVENNGGDNTTTFRSQSLPTGSTMGVGSFKPNSFGLYDMHGNVREWCSDWYKDHYLKADNRDPAGPPSGSGRVGRGGGWFSYAGLCRSAYRRWDAPDGRRYFLGFRLLRTSR